jgi:hypothetical protein
MAMDNPYISLERKIDEVVMDYRRLAGCEALQLDPDFDFLYFHLLNNDMLPDGNYAQNISAEISDEQVAFEVDQLVSIGRVATILGENESDVLKYLKECELKLASDDEGRGVILSSIKCFLEQRIRSNSKHLYKNRKY